MKILRTIQGGQATHSATDADGSSLSSRWKILIVDDDPDIVAVTRLNLKGFSFAARGANCLSAYSAAEAREILAEHEDIAVALIDVVMESDDSGLKLVEYIREEIGNRFIRLIIRTGQPGYAPERFVIDNYDIDDYKEKIELTTIKLYTTVRSAIKSYRDLKIIESNRRGLELVLNAVPGMYLHPIGDKETFFRDILQQILGLCCAGYVPPSQAKMVNGCIGTYEEGHLTIQAGVGVLAEPGGGRQGRLPTIAREFDHAVVQGDEIRMVGDDALLVILAARGYAVGFVYLENLPKLSADDRYLLRVFAVQCANAWENLCLNHRLKSAKDSAIRMLAVAAEFKDSETGNHVQRLARQTVATALELGVSAHEAEVMGQASMMHDIGKIGIPDAVLLKPGKLTDKEFEVIKSHPGIGAVILSEDKGFEAAHQVAVAHHERWDGTGYPSGLKGTEIPLAARIVSVVDVFDALVSKRAYKDAWSVDRALDEICRGAGSQFDPEVVEAFLRIHQRRREGRQKT